jgi:hypothetical protein
MRSRAFDCHLHLIILPILEALVRLLHFICNKFQYVHLGLERIAFLPRVHFYVQYVTLPGLDRHPCLKHSDHTISQTNFHQTSPPSKLNLWPFVASPTLPLNSTTVRESNLQGQYV